MISPRLWTGSWGRACARRGALRPASASEGTQVRTCRSVTLRRGGSRVHVHPSAFSPRWQGLCPQHRAHPRLPRRLAGADGPQDLPSPAQRPAVGPGPEGTVCWALGQSIGCCPPHHVPRPAQAQGPSGTLSRKEHTPSPESCLQQGVWEPGRPEGEGCSHLWLCLYHQVKGFVVSRSPSNWEVCVCEEGCGEWS